MPLKPFFTYFGGKYRAAPHYPAPVHDMIVEPFAGAAGYSLRYPDRQVVLIDKDPTIAALWKWLTEVSEDEIRSLPLEITDLREMDLKPEAKILIGFWLNKGTTSPCHRPSRWMREGLSPSSWWGETIRDRIASQVSYIRHWLVFHGSYRDVTGFDDEATWFIDPPYVKAGTNYRMGSKQIDYVHLGEWCRSRKGQVIVCEAQGADWLPFRPFRPIKASESRTGGKKSMEVIWTNEPAVESKVA